ncbi:aspartyl aminopeptidase [Arcanobacterium wilhelmae]|uniref:M18 family aminopeptidase n=1 Tax=Arcanobacterium wilhelmae TaxID=1803177 RepID=A0ABT9NC72_9ACTO|nr:M18 family aminopeptidase [Arcanobacterium wilhelmae]MDP9801307.1 aspartyl aminopeptidase [Arcanobacterium wilhelmae]WFN90650.1 M18 family aminopeptidase [Arcanobacterium wilhelmae]
MSISLPTVDAGAREFAAGFADFITASPTSFHAAANLAQLFEAAGFARQEESEAWAGERNGFALRDGAVIAWRIPEGAQPGTGVRIVGSHTDSPSFKVKPNSTSTSVGYDQVNVEVYGGPLLNSWLNRDLGIAGRVVTLDGEEHLVKTPAIMTIPQVAPHLDRSVNKELKLSAQKDYHPIWTTGEGELMEIIAQNAGVEADRIAAVDLFAYDTAAPQMFGGAEGTDFFAAGRQDNLTSVFSSLVAFLDPSIELGEDIQVFAAFNHEEIGSDTYSGAAGSFLEAILRRMAEGLFGSGAEAFERMLANSSVVSADAGHAINPNKPELHDPAHQPVLGGGPLLKINARGAYATDAPTSAMFFRAAAGAHVAVQEIVSNNDVPSGTTIGPITVTRLGIPTVDCGVPLLSMHSVREISAPADLIALAKLLKAYLED